MTPADEPRIPLEPAAGLERAADRRPRIPEPLPVRLIAVADVRLPAPPGLEDRLDALYAGILAMERQPGLELIYRTDNFCLHLQISEPPAARLDFRPLQVEVPSLAVTEMKLFDAQIECSRQRGLMPGEECLLLTDAAGNWVQITEYRQIG